MRFSIMIQLVVFTSLVLLATAAIFAWMQNRPRETKVNQRLLHQPSTSLYLSHQCYGVYTGRI